jgi:rRNA small subunit pseudouridine methyltransferase Nep1
MSTRQPLDKHVEKAEKFKKNNSKAKAQEATPAETPTTAPTDTKDTEETMSETPTPSAPTTAAENQLNIAATTRTKTTGPPKMIVVMSNACLETIKVRDRYELISADTHANILSKLNRSADQYRPDILHQCLLSLLDSPLNKAGHLKVYIETTSRVLIEVNPNLRIPRTFKRFAGLMVQLLRDLKIRSADGKETLLKVIKNPITQYFPLNALKVQTSVQGELTNIHDYIKKIEIETPVVFMIGAHSHGQHTVDWAEDTLALSQYPCSASVIIGRICGAFEQQMGIL